MPQTIVTEEIIELIHEGGGPGGGTPSGNEGGDGGDGRGSSGGARTPQRAYVTGMVVALAGILMFFMAFVSAYVVRKDMPNSAWIPLELPRILWLNTLILIASSITLTRARKLFIAKDQEGFRHWWATSTISGDALCSRADHRVAAAFCDGDVSGDESEQQLLLCFHRSARIAFAGRSAGAAVHPIRHAAQSGDEHGGGYRFDVLALHGWAMDIFVFTPMGGEVKRE